MIKLPMRTCAGSGGSIQVSRSDSGHGVERVSGLIATLGVGN
jgi:hypothetical protein